MRAEELEFKRVKAEDMHYYNKFYELRDNKTCDSVSLESFIWKDYHNVKAAVAKRDGEDVGLLWLMGSNEESPFSAMPLCKEEDLEYCFNLTVEYFNKVLKKTFKIHLADEDGVLALNLDKEKFEVKEETELKDYIYSGERMRTLAGRKLHKKKNLYNNFIKTYEGRYEYRNLACSDRNDVFKFLDKWRIQKGQEVEKHLDPEVEGIHEVLLNCKLLNIHMAGVYVDGELEAFTIGSLNKRHNMSVVHIEKANPEITGLYQFINKEFQVNEFPDVDIVNREDDLGIEGLRKAKESYDPIDYARKYYIKQKQE
jgi:hypothetical protein